MVHRRKRHRPPGDDGARMGPTRGKPPPIGNGATAGCLDEHPPANGVIGGRHRHESGETVAEVAEDREESENLVGLRPGLDRACPGKFPACFHMRLGGLPR